MKIRGQNWRDADKFTLIKIWADEEIQQEFFKITQRIKDAGYNRNFDQCT